MTTLPITNLHQSTAPWMWQLTHSEAATLAPQAVLRWLHVEDGCLWVTAESAGPHAPDLWLGAGESLELPAGSAWVVQAWPRARVSLLAPPALKQAVHAVVASARFAPKPVRPASRAWWQSSWFWPWGLPMAQRQRDATMA